MRPIVLALVAVLVACSDGDDGATSSTGSVGSSGTATSAPGATTTTGSGERSPLRVDLIDDAVAAVEAELGGPQDYYEINATPSLVNLFVAGEDAAVTAYAYVGGVLSSEELSGTAGGATFRAEALDFDPDTVTDLVAAELPASRQDVFEIVGGPGETVRYSIVVTSSAGGQLVVQVGADGAVIEVDPV